MASSSPEINKIKENSIKKESEVAVLSIIDKSYFNRNIPEETYEIPNKLYSISEESKDNNITLYNALYNSLINKDHKSFLFCIKQNNEVLIKQTVLQMNSDCVSKFIEKATDIFQSNSFYCNYIVPWIKNILKSKKFEIFSKKNVENLKKIQIFMQNKIKNFDSLCILKQKMNKINQIFYEKSEKNENILDEKNNKDNNKDKPIIFEPLLTYYESEDEDEIKLKKEKKNKMEIEGFEEIEKDEKDNDENMSISNEENDNDNNESEEDDLDDEIDNMFKDDNEITKNKNKKDIKNEEDNEENEDEEDENDD